MLHITRSLKITGLCALSLAFAVACGDSDDDNTPNPDATVTPTDTGPVFSDATIASDAGFMDAAPPRDAGHYCAANGEVDVDGTSVAVGSTDTMPTNSEGTPAVLSCIDDPIPTATFGQIAVFSCLQVIGSTTATAQELDDLEVAVFFSRDPMGNPVDPTFTSSTGADRQPEFRLNTDIARNTMSVCDDGVDVEIGRQTVGPNALRPATEYTIRLRSRTSTTGNGTWATTYHPFSIVNPEALRGGGGANCTPQVCTGFIDLVAVRADAISTFNTAANVNPAGADNLFDGNGDGYAIISASDCSRVPMDNAVAGFAPAPAAAGYIIDGAYSANAMVTDRSGLYMGLGFTPGTQVAGAVGVLRNAGACTEEFGGAMFDVYPDSVTVLRSGENLILHQ